tara:strand:- start:775 stop:2241 length:1467 start_codon:yes stop_codon:yes gene_type:complete
MAEKIVIEAEVKSNIGDVSKDAKSAAGEFKVMGVSLNGVKAGFASAAVTAKGFFGSIKAGLISTGIGAFVVLIGSLVSYFTNTKRGAETLERAMAGLGAIVSVLIDAFSSLGEIIIDTFTDPMPALKKFGEGLMKFLKDPTGATRDMFVKATLSVSDFTDELVEETKAMMNLKKLMQELRDEEREFSKVRAQTRQDIQKARLDALDESKTAEERLAALQKANDLELGTTAKSLEMQRRRIEVQREVMALSENMAEDLDELAALEVGLIDLQTQSFQTQKRLATEMETLTNEIAADKKAIDDKEWSDKIKANDDWNKEQQRLAKEEIALAEKVAKEKIAIAKAEGNAKIGLVKMGFGVANALAGENVALSKGVAMAQTVFQTQQAIMAAMGATSVADKLLPYPIRLANAIGAGVMGAAALSKIASTSPTGGGATAGTVSAPAAPAPQMMSGAFDISGGVAPEATKAYVVTDEMSNSQNQLANIRRRATI